MKNLLSVFAIIIVLSTCGCQATKAPGCNYDCSQGICIPCDCPQGACQCPPESECHKTKKK